METIGLVTHWPRITHLAVYPPRSYVLKTKREIGTAPTLS